MKIKFNDNLVKLANAMPCSIYAVGGYVRNYLINQKTSSDIDLSSSLLTEELLPYLDKFGFRIIATYDRTGTVVFSDGTQKYEYSAFRSESYAKGEHTPEKTVFKVSLYEDALRRDFKCNAIYYDVKNQEFVDPLGGIEDVKNKMLDTVTSPEKVFCHDGLRLMRLARFSGDLGFMATEDVLKIAKKYANNIKDISSERICEELKKILVADTAHEFSPKDGHYKALKVLDDAKVIDQILPEIARGRGMAQRKDYHKYDVLEHTLKTVLYADKSIRLAALFHDIGKPLCMLKNGKYHGHDVVGADLAREALNRLKFDKASIDEV